MPKTIVWMTPRIRFTEYIDSFDERFCDIAYNVWDVKDKTTYKRILKALDSGLYMMQTQIPWYLEPHANPDLEERHFLYIPDGGVEQLSKHIVKQMVRNFSQIWYWRPEIFPLVERDMQRFMKEDPKYRDEFHRWYRVERQDPYRKPNFYRDFLKDKIPMEGEV